MHVAKIRRRHGENEYVSHLVRRSIREGKRVRHETIANVSRLPAEAIEALLDEPSDPLSRGGANAHARSSR